MAVFLSRSPKVPEATSRAVSCSLSEWSSTIARAIALNRFTGFPRTLACLASTPLATNAVTSSGRIRRSRRPRRMEALHDPEAHAPARAGCGADPPFYPGSICQPSPFPFHDACPFTLPSRERHLMNTMIRRTFPRHDYLPPDLSRKNGVLDNDSYYECGMRYLHHS